MDKFDFSNLEKSIRSATETASRINHSHMEISDSIYKEKQEKIAREKKNIELQETIVEQNNQTIKMKEIELEFLRNMSEDTSQIVSVIKNLETINSATGKISEEGLLEIQEALGKLVENTNDENIYELFISEVKSQLVENGVSFGLQFLFTGLKTLLVKK